jgi:hypothetical protein
MKSLSKLLLACAVALAAIAISAAPSDAAKKKMAKCDPVAGCAVCKGKSCELMRCEADGKIYSHLPNQTCTPPNCPQKC